MYRRLRLTIVPVVAIVFASLPTSTPAQGPTTQIILTEKHVEGFIAAQKAVSAVLERMQGTTQQAKYRVELEGIIKKYGFKDFAEYETVAANIVIVLEGIDPQTKVFVDPHVAIKKEIDSVRADKTIPNSEKKQLLQELNEALKSAQSIEFPSNIELVSKYYDKIDVTTIANHDAESPTTSNVIRTIKE